MRAVGGEDRRQGRQQGHGERNRGARSTRGMGDREYSELRETRGHARGGQGGRELLVPLTYTSLHFSYHQSVWGNRRGSRGTGGQWDMGAVSGEDRGQGRQQAQVEKEQGADKTGRQEVQGGQGHVERQKGNYSCLLLALHSIFPRGGGYSL